MADCARIIQTAFGRVISLSVTSLQCAKNARIPFQQYRLGRSLDTATAFFLAAVLLGVLSAGPAFAVEEYYTVQIASHVSEKGASRAFNTAAKRLPEDARVDLRVEKIGKYYALRAGRYETRSLAVKLLTRVRAVYPKAIVIRARCIERRMTRVFKALEEREDPADSRSASEKKTEPDSKAGTGTKTTVGDKEKTASKTPPPVPPGLLDRIVAVVGEDLITWQDLQAELVWDFIPDWRGKPWVAATPYLGLRRLIERRLALRAADRAGIAVRTKDVDERIKLILEKGNLTEPVLETILQRRGIAREDLRYRVQDDLRIWELVVGEVVERLVVGEKDLRQYYDKHKHELGPPEERFVRLIRISEGQVADPEAYLKKLRGLLLEGVPFSVVAEEHSGSVLAFDGGDLGWLARRDVPGDLGDAIFSAEPGVASIFEYPRGTWNLLEVVDQRGGTAAFEDVKEEIRKILEDKMFEAAVERWIRKLEKETTVEIRISERAGMERRQMARWISAFGIRVSNR